MKKYWIETYGCQMNKAESESLVLQLRDSGWSRACSPEESDVIILNTCSVRITAEERVWGRIGFFRAQKKRQPFKLVVIGCMAERLKEGIIEKAPEVDFVIGNFKKHRIVEYIEHDTDDGRQKVFADTAGYCFSAMHRESSFRAYIPIMHGCDNYCSYCIVPFVRGREVSRNPVSILEEIGALSRDNVREYTLLGQNVNSYRYTNGHELINFNDLLESVSQRVGDEGWIRFLTSHPKDFSSRLVETIYSHANICRHIHLPMQHASDPILDRMNRKYTIGYYKELIDSIRNVIPDISVTTDIMIGFPGETEHDFRTTLDSMEEIRFDDAFTYKYNPREGTAAFTMEDTVDSDVKLERLGTIIKLQRKISIEKKKQKMGETVKVLVEAVSKKNDSELLARTEQDEMVVFPGNLDKIGSFSQIELVGLSGNTFTGKETIPCHGN